MTEERCCCSGAQAPEKPIWLFEEGNAQFRNLLGGKGCNLAEMTSSVQLPVPPGFTGTTEVCTYYYDSGKEYPQGFWDEVEKAVKATEEKMGKKFGDPANPLFFSVRSGARESMPGMMDTVLNLGINDQTVDGFARQMLDAEGNPNYWTAWDSYRRFCHMFGDVVMGVDEEGFEEILDELKKGEGAATDQDLSVEALKASVAKCREFIKQQVVSLPERIAALEKDERKADEVGFLRNCQERIQREGVTELPQEPMQQLRMSIDAVYGSWNTPRAITYRKLNKIPDEWGTAVNIQVMVFGNRNDKSGTGVAFTRDPKGGARKCLAEYLINAQGEDVVSGARTPFNLEELADVAPDVYQQLTGDGGIFERLEQHYRDLQDVEFTVEDGRLFVLQTRSGKRTGGAAVKIAVDMVNEGLITKEEGLMRVKPEQLDQVLHPMIDPKADVNVLATGLPASPGAAQGTAVFDSDEAAEIREQDPDAKLLLVRTMTTPEDIGGMHAAQGILTSVGGMTSHAAVVARGMGTPCICGCSAMKIDYANQQAVVTLKSGETTLIKKGDWVTLDGTTGRVIEGKPPVVDPELGPEFETLMSWAKEVKTIGVRTNSDTPKDTEKAYSLGAEGIGLCRTEHMFFEEDRINIMRSMIIADSTEERRVALDKLLPMQRSDFEGIFRAMKGQPVTIRLLDPPLHEFLPHEEEEAKGIAEASGIPLEKLLHKAKSLKEENPMMGFRGMRLGVLYPEISEMQAQAIIEGAITVQNEGMEVHPEIMVPVVQNAAEMAYMKELIVATAEKVIEEQGVKVPYVVGTMIETPAASVTADQIAEHAAFFSFGTNDLTQLTKGFSRDDYGRFIGTYVEKKILPEDPFVSLDQSDVGRLVALGVEGGRKTDPDLKIGICGEHGGDPDSVKFCHRTGLNYVSCSPYRVPIAILSAAQAALEDKEK